MISETYEWEIIKALRQLGLDEEEGEVVLSLVRNGEQTIGQLSTSTSVSRTKLYYVLDKLVADGWVKIIHEKPKTFMVCDIEKTIKHKKGIIMRAINTVKKTLLPLYKERLQKRKLESLEDLDLLERIEDMLTRCKRYVLIVPNFIPQKSRVVVMKRIENLKSLGVTVAVVEKSMEKKINIVLSKLRNIFGDKPSTRYAMAGMIIVDGKEMVIASRDENSIVRHRRIYGIWTSDPGIVAFGEAMFATIVE